MPAGAGPAQVESHVMKRNATSSAAPAPQLPTIEQLVNAGVLTRHRVGRDGIFVDLYFRPEDTDAFIAWIEMVVRATIRAYKAGGARHKRGPRVKQPRLQKRNQLVGQWSELGLEPEAIMKLLKEQYPELVRNGDGWISEASMMTQYNRSERARR